ncbi:MHYT domain-containing protein [Caballeronia sp. Sq4a]|uniref:MHYT domain-containing protein n=1 Tax=Caballeronia sp. Sq4a TaxID=2878152 RepID=UPI0020BFE9C2|nr:MHYT domain-containing protein [Caballeronia sp. Sq4a]
MSGSFSLPLVGLSILLATALSFVALLMVGARFQNRGANSVWVAATALVLGTGIWSMHFVGMLAFSLPVPIGFDFATTLSSWAAAVLVCWLGLTFVMTPRPAQSAVLLGSLLMGAGIAVMHYAGMSAMQMTPAIAYMLPRTVLSVLIGIGASYAALRIVIGLRALEKAQIAKQAAAACLMGVAVSGLHYTAMAAAVFAPNCVSRAATDFNQRDFVLEIFIAVLAVLGIALIAALLQTRKEARVREEENSRQLSVTTGELIASEQRFRAAQEVAIDPFLILKALRTGATITDFIFEYANPAALRFLGATESDVIGQRFLTRFPTASMNGLFAVHARVCMGDGPATIEQEYVGDGMSAWLRINSVKLFDGVAITFADITERKALEQLAEVMLEDRSKALALAEKKSVVIDAFIAAVSHELRNPVNAVLSWVEVLKRTSATTASTTGNALRRIEDSAKAQARLVNDLLDASAVASGKVRLAMENVQLAELVASTVSDSAIVASKGGVEVCLGAAEDCVVVADEHRLRQVLANVLQNAVKFSNPGGTVTANLVRSVDSATIEVRDTGIGIEPAMLPHVFERFAQEGSKDRSRLRGGVGLGLAISRQLIEAHGGKIEAFSDGPGTGTTVSISLPMSGPISKQEDVRTTDYF